jgi:membrane protease YdiL (CAAX protease family)
MDQRPTPHDAAISQSVMDTLARAAEGVVRNDPGAVEQVFALAGNADLPASHQRAAEAIGMMIVKLEAREHDLELRNERLETAAHLRAQASLMLTHCILFISGYTLAFAALRGILRIPGAGLVSTLYNLGVLAAMAASCVWMALHSRLPLAAFGLSLAGGRRAVGESLIVGMLLCGGAVLLKAGLPDAAMGDAPFFNWASLTGLTGLTLLAIYALSSLLQEILARGVLQGMLERVIVGRHANSLSILLASSIFATMHVHLSALIGLAAFAQGVIFGLLYRRHRNVSGVALAHFLFGAFSLSVLGFDHFLYWTE